MAMKIMGEMERVPGIEPGYSAWKAAALPLSYTRAPADYAFCSCIWQRPEQFYRSPLDNQWARLAEP